MRNSLDLLFNSAVAGQHWFSQAWYDENILFAAIAAHATPNAIVLSMLAAGSMAVFWTVLSQARRRAVIIGRKRSITGRFESAISGYAQFRSALAQSSALSPSTDIATSSALRTARTGTRTETKVMDVKPHNEQDTIDLMARFKWELQSSQRVRWQDSHIEKRGDDYYNVTESENYVHLVFVRNLDHPNIGRIKSLEREYFSIVIPYMPGYAGPAIVMFLGMVTGPLVIVVWGLCIAWIMNISKRRKVAEVEIPRLRARQAAILSECDEL